ncbi:Cys-tRNA(Pro) deacylase [Sinomonas halotolerans]|uniref:Cys-tRNA(Pro)/Cys-tRNA(Cys) deacylase n=1 Tax=Sinomonas halotolerans TaxID=1644133 RepID=A0ABU9X2L1_9MICC
MARKRAGGQRAQHDGEAPGTPATTLLEAAGVRFAAHLYAHDPAAEGYGLEAAKALGVEPERVFKTLLISVGEAGRLCVAVVPVTGSLDLKAAAAAFGAKRAVMADPAAAERRTGYVRGGISPLGQRHRSPTAVDDSALAHATVFVSGGRRGFDIELDPADLVRLTEAVVAPVRAS